MSTFHPQKKNSYLTEKEMDKLLILPQLYGDIVHAPPRPPPRPMPPILRIIDSDQYVSLVVIGEAATAATAATADTAAAPRRRPSNVAIDMPDGCIKEPGCIKETRKACTIWLMYCVCVFIGSCFPTSYIILRKFWSTKFLIWMSLTKDVPRTSNW